MQCPKCQAVNSDKAKFCLECGQKLDVNALSVAIRLHPLQNFATNAVLTLQDICSNSPAH